MRVHSAQRSVRADFERNQHFAAPTFHPSKAYAAFQRRGQVAANVAAR
jgi:hypothetical protein